MIDLLSGDSTVDEFSFDGRFVEFVFDDYDSNELYRIVIETLIVYSETPNGDGRVHMRLVETSDLLEVDQKSGRFMLPAEFAKQMAAINQGHQVLAGLKAEDFTHLFVLQGNGKLIVCPIKGEESIQIVRES